MENEICTEKVQVDSILEYGAEVETEMGQVENSTSVPSSEDRVVSNNSSKCTTEAVNVSSASSQTVDKEVTKSEEQTEYEEKKEIKSKLNPAAATYQAKGYTHASVNSTPNLNMDSTGSNGFRGYKDTVKRHSTYSDVCKNGGLFVPPQQYPPRKTNLEMSQQEGDEILGKSGTNRNAVSNSQELKDLLKKYILKKCSLNAHCNSEDFDGTALDGLTKLSFVQSLQAVEHYGASVSDRIVKKPAYLMGIIRGQESHWENSRAAAKLEGGAGQLLHIPKKLLLQVGHYCLEGNCLPSDFTPEVVLSLHSLTVEYSMKAINAFDSNKRIVAGCRGGVVNRPRFLQRLIENVIQQNPISLATIKKEQKNAAIEEKHDDRNNSVYSSPKSFMSLLGSNNSRSVNVHHGEGTPESTSSAVQLSVEEKMSFLERELTDRIERERRLRQELGNLRVQVGYWEKECHRLNSTITHILHNQGH